MNSIFNLKIIQLKDLYDLFVSNKSKEKLTMVLEPLQAIIQIALLSVLPIGTKIAIQENILYLQLPSIIQPISRWYNINKKDDIFFLFQVIKRFIRWYNPNTSKNSPLSVELYQLIKKMSIDGLNNLLRTYNNVDCNALIQVVSMYKTIIENDDKDFDKIVIDNPSNDTINIDEVFEKIIKIYDEKLISIIYNMMLILKNEENIDSIYTFITGLNYIMDKNNKKIQNWIKITLMV
jgi:hypothetical protein